MSGLPAASCTPTVVRPSLSLLPTTTMWLSCRSSQHRFLRSKSARPPGRSTLPKAMPLTGQLCYCCHLLVGYSVSFAFCPTTSASPYSRVLKHIRRCLKPDRPGRSRFVQGQCRIVKRVLTFLQLLCARAWRRRRQLRCQDDQFCERFIERGPMQRLREVRYANYGTVPSVP